MLPQTEPLHLPGTAKKRQKRGETSWEEPCGSLKFGVLKLGGMPEVKMLDHMLREPRVLMEIGETGVIDCFSVEVHCRVGMQNFQLWG